MYTIKLEQFSGPLSLFLQLLEKEKLDISRISIAKVTDEFLIYLDQIKEENISEIVDFLYFAAKLIYLKSVILLPYINPEDEQEILNFERNLKVYKEFQESIKIIRKILNKKKLLFSREKFFLTENLFIPPKNLNVKKLAEVFQLIARDLQKEYYIVQKIRKKAISLAEKIKEIAEVIKKNKKINFISYISAKKTKAEVVVSFLAVLELVKRGTVILQQEEIFGEINVSNVESIT